MSQKKLLISFLKNIVVGKLTNVECCKDLFSNKGKQQKSFSVNGLAIERGGGWAINEKRTFLTLFFILFQIDENRYFSLMSS